ncbi:MAG TPA: hypothetical protein V6C65_04370 [Allocoleopsis sp.]
MSRGRIISGVGSVAAALGAGHLIEKKLGRKLTLAEGLALGSTVGLAGRGVYEGGKYIRSRSKRRRRFRGNFETAEFRKSRSDRDKNNSSRVISKSINIGALAGGLAGGYSQAAGNNYIARNSISLRTGKRATKSHIFKMTSGGAIYGGARGALTGAALGGLVGTGIYGAKKIGDRIGGREKRRRRR